MPLSTAIVFANPPDVHPRLAEALAQAGFEVVFSTAALDLERCTIIVLSSACPSWIEKTAAQLRAACRVPVPIVVATSDLIGASWLIHRGAVLLTISPEEAEKGLLIAAEIGRLWRKASQPRCEWPEPSFSFTQREKDVLLEVRRGLPYSAVARALKISVRTVQFHTTNAMRKLGVTSRAELMATHTPGEYS